MAKSYCDETFENIYIYLASVDSSLSVFVILDATIHIQNMARPYTPPRASQVESI